MSMLVYPLFANWVWGGGWLAQLGSNFGLGHGHVDFAGSSVVHMVGGVAALTGAAILGPRMGKYTRDGKPNAIELVLVERPVLPWDLPGQRSGATAAGSGAPSSRGTSPARRTIAF
jgi:Amt family ammonium transporter